MSRCVGLVMELVNKNCPVCVFWQHSCMRASYSLNTDKGREDVTDAAHLNERPPASGLFKRLWVSLLGSAFYGDEKDLCSWIRNHAQTTCWCQPNIWQKCLRKRRNTEKIHLFLGVSVSRGSSDSVERLATSKPSLWSKHLGRNYGKKMFICFCGLPDAMDEQELLPKGRELSIHLCLSRLLSSDWSMC